MFERFTERARRVLVLAQDEARRSGHPAIAPEHLLLGVARDGDGLAQSLKSCGLGVGVVRAAIIPGDQPAGPEPGSRPFATESKRGLELALRRALQLGDEEVGKVHLLLGLGDLADEGGFELLDRLEVPGQHLREMALDARGGRQHDLGADGAARQAPPPRAVNEDGSRGANEQGATVVAERPRPDKVAAEDGAAGGGAASMPYCPWCDSPFRARWWWQKATGAATRRELGVVVIGCAACGTVVSVVAPPATP